MLAVQGKNTVQDELAKQQITGTPDMTPDAIKAEAKQAGLTDEQVNGHPTCSVAGALSWTPAARRAASPPT